MAKPFEGFPATVLQTPDILGQGMEDLFVAKKIEALQQPEQPEYKMPDLPEVPEYSDIYGNIVNASVQPVLNGTIYGDLGQDLGAMTAYVNRSPRNVEEAQRFQQIDRRVAGQTSFATRLGQYSQEFSKNLQRIEQAIADDEMYDSPENRNLVVKARTVVDAIDDATQRGTTPVYENGTGYLPITDYGLQLLPKDVQERVLSSQQGLQDSDGTTIYRVPEADVKNFLTMRFTPEKSSSLNKRISAANVGSVDVTTETPLEGQEGIYVTVGSKRYPKENIGSAVGNEMFFGFNAGLVQSDGTIPMDAFYDLELTGPAMRAARDQGYLEDGQMTPQEKKEFYEKNLKYKESQLSTSFKRTLSGTGKGGGGYTNKLGAAPLQAQGKDLTQIKVTDDAGMQRTRQGLGASIKPYVIKTSNPENTKQNYMVVSDIFSTTDENGNPQVYLKGQYVSLKETDIFRDEGIAGINKRLAESEDETRALSDFVLSEQPTEWMLPNDELESQYRANIGRTVKETIDFDKLYSIPYAVRGMKAPEKDKDPLGIIE